MMHSLTVASTEIRQFDGLYSLNDLHKAAGGEDRHKPAFFLRNDQTQALIEEIQCADSHTAQVADLQLALKVVYGGQKRGSYACRELVYAYAMWINAKFHLTVIRAFDSMQSGSPPPQRKPRTAPLPSPVRDILAIGRELRKMKGMSEAVATAATLETIRINTGIDIAPMAKSLPKVELENIASLNAGEVGEPLGLKAHEVNRLLTELGLQSGKDSRGERRLTEAGAAYGEMKPFSTGKHTGYEIRWRKSVIPVLRDYLDQILSKNPSLRDYLNMSNSRNPGNSSSFALTLEARQ